MFFSKKNLLEAQFFRGFIDYHSHILPGVDDGVQSLDEAIEVLRWYEELGVMQVTLTPHVMEDFPRNNAAMLRDEFSQLKAIYDGPIELSLAAEYMIDSMFERHLDSGDLLTIADNYLLVESSYIEAPFDFFGRVERVMKRGYFVVLAHPERYAFLSNDDYRRLKEMGVLFQLNLLSLLDVYGRRVRERALKLLSTSMYDIVGSDIHNLAQFQKIIRSAKLSRKVMDSISILNTDCVGR